MVIKPPSKNIISIFAAPLLTTNLSLISRGASVLVASVGERSSRNRAKFPTAQTRYNSYVPGSGDKVVLLSGPR